MKEDIELVQKFYDSGPEQEWLRLERQPYEFAITTRIMERYVRPGDRVLDIGGGPGRYSIYWAKRGCEVTLLDLSPGNVAFAQDMARREGASISAVSGDARFADTLVDKKFDHVFLMGPMYHLLEEADREQAVRAAIRCLKPGGLLYTSFISIFGGLNCYMRSDPSLLLTFAEMDKPIIEAFLAGRGYSGDGFTKVYMTVPQEAAGFMARFPLDTVCFFGQEGIMQPCMDKFLMQPDAVQQAWIDLSLRLCQMEEALCFSEHLMHIGRLRQADDCRNAQISA